MYTLKLTCCILIGVPMSHAFTMTVMYTGPFGKQPSVGHMRGGPHEQAVAPPAGQLTGCNRHVRVALTVAHSGVGVGVGLGVNVGVGVGVSVGVGVAVDVDVWLGVGDGAHVANGEVGNARGVAVFSNIDVDVAFSSAVGVPVAADGGHTPPSPAALVGGGAAVPAICRQGSGIIWEVASGVGINAHRAASLCGHRVRHAGSSMGSGVAVGVVGSGVATVLVCCASIAAAPPTGSKYQ